MKRLSGSSWNGRGGKCRRLKGADRSPPYGPEFGEKVREILNKTGGTVTKRELEHGAGNTDYDCTPGGTFIPGRIRVLLAANAL